MTFYFSVGVDRHIVKHVFFYIFIYFIAIKQQLNLNLENTQFDDLAKRISEFCEYFIGINEISLKKWK